MRSQRCVTVHVAKCLESGGVLCCQLQHLIVIHSNPMGRDFWLVLYAVHIKNFLIMCENIKRKTS